MRKKYKYLTGCIFLLLTSLFFWREKSNESTMFMNSKADMQTVSQNDLSANSINNSSQTKAVQYGYPLYFEQSDSQKENSYLTRGIGYAFYFTPKEMIAVLQKHEENTAKKTILNMHFVDAQSNSTLKASEEQASKSHYFKGNDPSKWRTNVPHYAKITYENLYPGIQAVFYGNQRRLEYDIVVAPGADPKQVRLQIDGAKKLLINDEGTLQIFVSDSENLVMNKPTIYQNIKNQTIFIPGNFTLLADNLVGFVSDSFNPEYPLIIDPILDYSTFLGGGSADFGNSIAVDSSGNAYVTGQTLSTDFPIENAFQPQNNGNYDVFITKMNAAGTVLLYSTYLGGTQTDIGRGIAVDFTGNAYVTGYTNSSDFFTTLDAFQTTLTGSQNIFISKLDSTGIVTNSTYLGGTGIDSANDVALDSNNNVYITGRTSSMDFPTQNAYQSSRIGGQDVIFAKLNTTLSGPLLYSTYLGGSSNDIGWGIAVDFLGNAYITGNTTSTDFPITPEVFQPSFGGNSSGFVSKFNPTLSGSSSLIYSTFLGSSGYDSAYGIAVDSDYNAYITGTTNSASFPTTAGAYQAEFGGYVDAFVTKLNPAGSILVYSTFLGSSQEDGTFAIAVDNNNNACVTGYTFSLNFPITDDAFQKKFTGVVDAFVTKFNAAGSALIYSTFLGGNGEAQGNGIAIDNFNNIYITGFTNSTDFPTTPNAAQTTYGGGADAFIAKFEFAITVTSVTPNVGPTLGGTIITITGINFLNATEVFFGTTPATFFEIVSNTEIRALSPPHTEGSVDITVVGPSGNSVITPADIFTYQKSITNLVLFAPNQTLPDDPVTLTAVLSSSENIFYASGTVYFYEGATLLGIAPVIGGEASLTLPLSNGTHLINAVYSGDANFLSSESNIITIIVSDSVSASVFPPTGIVAFQKSRRCTGNCVNVIKWNPPTQGNPPVSYRIYSNESLTQLVAEIPANQKVGI